MACAMNGTSLPAEVMRNKGVDIVTQTSRIDLLVDFDAVLQMLGASFLGDIGPAFPFSREDLGPHFPHLLLFVVQDPHERFVHERRGLALAPKPREQREALRRALTEFLIGECFVEGRLCPQVPHEDGSPTDEVLFVQSHEPGAQGRKRKRQYVKHN